MMDPSKIEAPDLDALPVEADWSPVAMPFNPSGTRSFVEGDPKGNRLRIRMYLRESDGRLVSRVWFGPHAEGPPGHAHGGSVAAVLDHTMGVAAWVAGHPVLAASITINFRHKLPLRRVCTVETWVSKSNGKKVITQGQIYGENPERPYSTSEGLFITQDIEKFAGLLEEAEGPRANWELDT